MCTRQDCLNPSTSPVTASPWPICTTSLTPRPCWGLHPRNCSILAPMLAHGLPVSLEGQLGARSSLCFPSKLKRY
ncbi:hypothetical protein NC653_007151 [Populus alba x Populus x berolinensis]|uniref:Uncharacterized protein n=1 Tax=Populus alba x Populus x berolinensis TaxID=444605 RepID=A0AAD6RG65_9ROSI|nr:hypothetical protein NC653_007151 [Populus alba x Populus x berolinensis]